MGTHTEPQKSSHTINKSLPPIAAVLVEVEKQRYKDTKAHIIIETLKIGISELQFVNCIQIHANDHWESGWERGTGGISGKGGVFAGNAPWNWSSHLKQFESAHMLCPKLNWTELNPCYPSADANTAKRYTKIQKDTKRYTDAATNGFAARLSRLLFAWWLICLISLPIFLSLCLSVSEICAYVWSKVVCLLVFSPFEPLITRATCRQGRR